MDDDFYNLSIMDAYDDNGELMRHQIGTMIERWEQKLMSAIFKVNLHLTLQPEPTLVTTNWVLVSAQFQLYIMVMNSQLASSHLTV